MHFIAVNDQIGDRGLGISTVYGNAKPVAAASGSVAALKIILDVMDVVFQQFNMGARSHHADAQRSEPMFGGAEVANFKPLDAHVALVVNGDDALSAGGSEMCRVQDCRFAWMASEGNEAVARVAGCVDTHQFFVGSTANVDGTARPCRVCGVLNGAPRRRLRTGIRIIPGRRHVEGGVDLAKRSRDRH